jgi:hypothetical protein
MILHDQEIDGMRLKVTYDGKTNEYIVNVSHPKVTKEERFRAIYKPVFGPDAQDVAEFQEIANRLLDEVEAEVNGGYL